MAQQYLHPITYDAVLFLRSFNYWSKEITEVDEVLVSTLKSVKTAIDTFLDEDRPEILESEQLPLAKVESIDHIRKYYFCSICQQNLEREEDLARHIAEKSCCKIKSLKELKPEEDTYPGTPKTSHDNEDRPEILETEQLPLAKVESIDDERPEILETEQLPLVKVESINHIRKYYFCRICHQHLEREEDVAWHIAGESCSKIKSFKELKLDLVLEEGTFLRTPKTYHDIIIHDLTKDLKNFIKNEVATDLKNLPSYKTIKTDLINSLQSTFPDKSINIIKFGSRMNGSGTPMSNLNCYLDIDNTVDKYYDRMQEEAFTRLCTVQTALYKARRQWRDISRGERALVPVLRATHIATNIECEFSFFSSLGNANSKFLEYIFELQPIALHLCRFVTAWKCSREIGSYTLKLMVIFYLQTLNMLPSMERLQRFKNPENAKTKGPWLYTFKKLSLERLNIEKVPVDEDTLLKLIHDFYRFYMNFDFQDSVVCPYLGGIIKMPQVIDLMPDRYIQSRADCQKLRMRGSITVQDPIELNSNTARPLKPDVIQTEFLRALIQLKTDYPHLGFERKIKI